MVWQRAEQPLENVAQCIQPLKSFGGRRAVIHAIWTNSFLPSADPLRTPKLGHIGQRSAWTTPEPPIMTKIEIVGDRDPDNAPTGLRCKSVCHRDADRLLPHTGLELDMSLNNAARHHQIIAKRIKLGAHYLDIRDAPAPQMTKRFTNEDVLDNTLAQR